MNIADRPPAEHSGGRVVCSSGLLLQVGEALAEGQMAGQLDKANQIAALAAAVAVEDIFARVHVERGPGLLVQRTESDKLGAAAVLRKPFTIEELIQVVARLVGH